jgi:hypothetical protein
MHTLANYVASATFLSKVGWGQDGYAHMLKNKDDKDNAVIIVVGKVVDDHLSCGPTGNWASGNQYGSLKNVKYNFTLGQPDEEVFANDFETAFKTLGKIQSSVASTPNRLHFLLGEGDKFKTLRFSTNVFEERAVVSFPFLPPSPLPSFCWITVNESTVLAHQSAHSNRQT